MHCSMPFYIRSRVPHILVSKRGPGTNPPQIRRADCKVFEESEVICGFSNAWQVGAPNPRVVLGSIVSSIRMSDGEKHGEK